MACNTCGPFAVAGIIITLLYIAGLTLLLSIRLRASHTPVIALQLTGTSSIIEKDEEHPCTDQVEYRNSDNSEYTTHDEAAADSHTINSDLIQKKHGYDVETNFDPATICTSEEREKDPKRQYIYITAVRALV